MRAIPTSEAWAVARVAGLPVRWKKRILSTHADKLGSDERGANIELRELVDKLAKVRLSLDAGDSEITARAEEFAGYAMDCGRVQIGLKNVRLGMESFCRSCGVEPPKEKTEDRPAIARMTCRDWWRRGLRKMHAKAVEGAAIQLGYVNKARDLYISNESLARRAQQIRRNTRMMENTLMRNEDGQEYTLAELAAVGVGNKAIRRGELMTRIAGFEKIAVECGHGGLFLTVTCPSRMHKWISSGKAGRVYANDKYDGTTPREAQKYLSQCWARIRSGLARRGVKLYGFRIAEPHHDGCPHWHVLVFHAQEWPGATKRRALPRIVSLFRRYLLADSAGERGARTHRVKAEVIDWKRGTAAGYIAKYVAKNIDGLHVESDLYGNPAMETSQRVEAWASTWGIRQFQQIGGAPVGVWRELRRVKDMPEGAPKHLKAAHEAVNRVEGVDGAETKSADWAGYCKAQGGVFVGRGAFIQVAKDEGQTGELGRYGEAMTPRPVGVKTIGAYEYFIGRFRAVDSLFEWVVKSARKVWEVVRRAGFSAPWTGVNNCTREKLENEYYSAGSQETERGCSDSGAPKRGSGGGATGGYGEKGTCGARNGTACAGVGG